MFRRAEGARVQSGYGHGDVAAPHARGEHLCLFLDTTTRRNTPVSHYGGLDSGYVRPLPPALVFTGWHCLCVARLFV